MLLLPLLIWIAAMMAVPIDCGHAPELTSTYHSTRPLQRSGAALVLTVKSDLLIPVIILVAVITLVMWAGILHHPLWFAPGLA